MQRIYDLLCVAQQRWEKTIRIMKLTAGLILFAMFTTSAVNTYSQTVRLSLNLKNATIVDIFREIERNSEFGFFFKSEEFNLEKRQSIKVSDATVDEVLKKVLDENYSYRILDKNIVVTRGRLDVVQQQSKKVNGKVTDQTGTAVPGVSIVVKGTTTGVTSDIDGNYSITVPGDAAVLQFYFVGMKTQEIPVTGKSTVNVILEESAVGIDEVIVVGYGEQSRRKVTGAVSRIDGGFLQNKTTASVGTLLQGAVSGVQVVAGTGQPGAGSSIRIRGGGSFTAGNDPLYVVDGVPIISTSVSLGGERLSPLNPLADMNPNDIESISVLKDAASSSIYGSSAANGVILITTKKGKLGKAQVDFNVFSGVQRITQTLPVLSARQSRDLFIEKWVYGWNGLKPLIAGVVGNTYRPEAVDSLNPGMGLGASSDHQNAIFRIAPITKADFSVRGADEKFIYSLSGEYFDQEGILINSGFRRLTTRINAEYKANKWLKMGTNFSYSNTTSKRTQEDTEDGGVWMAFINTPSYAAMYDPVTGLPAQTFPINTLNEEKLRGFTNRVFGNIYAEVQIMKDIKFRSNIAIDVSDIYESQFFPATTQSPAGNSYPRYSASGTTFRNRLVNENYITFTRTFNEDHNVTVMAGQSLQKELSRDNYLVGTNGSTDKLTTANASSILRSISSTETSSALLSYYARLNYAYKSKYLLAASFRADGSSKFGKDNRFANFPSFSAGWVVNEESFLKDVSLVTQLKLRAAWGKTGNQTALGNFQALGLVVPGYDYVNPGIGPTSAGIPNQGLLWEASSQADIGVDFTILKGRIGIIADWYSKTTESLLLNEPLPYTSGFQSVIKNIGKVKNNGVDLELNAKILTGRFKWDMGGNISFLTNKVLALGSNNAAMVNGRSIIEVGKPMGNFYGWVFKGVYATNADVPAGAGPNGKLAIPGNNEFVEGTPIFVDQNKDGLINEADRVVIGNALADYTGAFNNSFNFKGFEFNTMFTFSKGNEIANTIRAGQDSHTGLYRNCTPEAWNGRWRKTGDITNWPRLVVENTMYGSYYSQSTQFIEDGSFIRLRNITLAYNFTDKITKKLQISKLRIYVTGENIRTWTKYTGYDPELINIDNPLALGYSASRLPMSLSVIFGVNIGL